MIKRIVFLIGTRADFGKMRSLLDYTVAQDQFEVHIFVTGMHMLRKYGLTCNEVVRRGYRNIHKYINQNYNDTMDVVLGKTIQGLSDYVKEIQPDLLVVHGDRVEALAGACVGSLNNILVAHVEGGEVSGTVDALIRHAVTKMAHLHFVSNERAADRLRQLGEDGEQIFVIGSPDIDIMLAGNLPSFNDVQQRYDIHFEHFAILIFHPVTTEIKDMPRQAKTIVDSVIDSGKNFVVIYPNNDLGSDIILSAFERFDELPSRFRIIPSMRFEYFLSLLKQAKFILGNSSCALVEAPYYGVPAINIGSRQMDRADLPSVIHCACEERDLNVALSQVDKHPRIESTHAFGSGGAARAFGEILNNPFIWSVSNQKQFCSMRG